ncbi:MAG: hypothetical protein FJ100_22260, partial [Deltaproteobacteria bacterium]|nr:hypothetical protein [Deltaproteobacteria bacterium]
MPTYDLAFFHPVGPHVGESLEGIIQRKQAEIRRYGRTYWSFAPARPDRVNLWREELQRASLVTCPVLCCGATTTDPQRTKADEYWAANWSADQQVWQPLPKKVTNYHRPARNGILASAFVVTDIAVPADLHIQRPSHWLAVDPPEWRRTSVPTRGEYLVRDVEAGPAGSQVKLVLTVAAPFVVWIDQEVLAK